MNRRDTDAVAALVRRHPDALLLPVQDGAQLAALQWLEQLDSARRDWQRAYEDDTPNNRRSSAENIARALHQARVALRRLRSVVREHRALLGTLAGARTRRALRTLARVSNGARDADVQRAWLDAEQDTLPSDAHAEVIALRAWLEQGRDAQNARVAKAFRHHFDDVVDRMQSRLLTCVVPHAPGEPPDVTPFARHVADRLALGAVRLKSDLTRLANPGDGLTADQTRALLHKIRIRLKRQRTMLASCHHLHPAFGNWYALLTRGQDVLGALRDAERLATVAEALGLFALTRALHCVALSHREGFARLWSGDLHDVTRAQDAAIEAMRHLGMPVVSPALPMEIERKYLLRACPPHAATTDAIFIEQGWLPGTVLRERLRRAVTADGTTRLTRTIKLGPMGARIEVEEDTDAHLFDVLWPCTRNARIRKHRYAVPDGTFVWEIDVFLDRELIVAEVELGAGDRAPVAPVWLAPFIVRDISEDPAYLNAVLARPDPPRHPTPTAPLA